MSNEEPSPAHCWKEVAYTVQIRVMPGSGMVVICGQGYGIREDGSQYFATYDLPLVYPEGFEWTAEVRKRLDTFLDQDCSCSRFGQCAYHAIKAGEWAAEDLRRNRLAEHEIPQPLRKLLLRDRKIE